MEKRLSRIKSRLLLLGLNKEAAAIQSLIKLSSDDDYPSDYSNPFYEAPRSTQDRGMEEDPLPHLGYCGACEQMVPLEDLFRDSARPDFSWCRDCKIELTKNSIRDLKEEIEGFPERLERWEKRLERANAKGDSAEAEHMSKIISSIKRLLPRDIETLKRKEEELARLTPK
jgi:hypothetical protein